MRREPEQEPISPVQLCQFHRTSPSRPLCPRLCELLPYLDCVLPQALPEVIWGLSSHRLIPGEWLIWLAPPKRFEVLTPRFVVWRPSPPPNSSPRISPSAPDRAPRRSA